MLRLMACLRVAITGSDSGASLSEVLELLGRERCVRRLGLAAAATSTVPK